jgi:hypothetical protein
MRPILIVNPRSDPEFAALVEQLAGVGVRAPLDLEARLRARYPRVVVRERSISDEEAVTWYVYRDGRWTPSTA